MKWLAAAFLGVLVTAATISITAWISQPAVPQACRQHFACQPIDPKPAGPVRVTHR